MLRNLIEKIDSMQKQMIHISRKMVILRKNFLKMLEIKTTATEMKNVLMGSLVDLAKLRKKIVNSRISQLKLLKLKSKEKRLG